MIGVVRTEILKMRRSRAVWGMSAGVLLGPLLVASLLLAVRGTLGPDAAGLDAASAEVVAQLQSPDWAFFLDLTVQMLTGGLGLIVFSLMTVYVFAREYREHTYTAMLTVPRPRWAFVLGKLGAILTWMAAVTVAQLALSVAFGALLGIGDLDPGVLVDASLRMLSVTGLFFLSMPVVGWLACVGRGYFLPMTVVALAIVGSVPAAATEAGDLLPWIIPTAFAEGGSAGTAVGALETSGMAVLAATFLFGIAATIITYRRSDAPA